jgi:flagellar hook protein FlgE
VLGDFDNTWGLKKMGSNLFAETVTSGPAIRNVPGASGMGDVSSNSLEMSNSDLATEFVNMITAQKAYSANARVITTQDQMMTELMNIKR